MKIEQAKRLKELEKENARLKKLVADLSLDKQMLLEVVEGKFLSPRKKYKAVSVLCEHYPVSQAGMQVTYQPRATQHYMTVERDDEESLTKRIIELASMFGRYGFRRITVLLRFEDHKRIERIWRREGLQIPQKQPKRGRLYLGDSS